MKKHIPNTITLLNLISGCCALVAVLGHNFVLAFWFLLISIAADYLDGAVARLLKVKSPLGKELDSFADMVSFGVVPGAIFYMLLAKGWEDSVNNGLVWGALPGFVLSAFSGLRLAKFNLDTRQESHFLGLPTPSCTLFVVGLMLIYEFNSFQLQAFVVNPIFLLASVLILSYLLISEIPMFNLKFSSFNWEGNEVKYVFLLLSIIGFIFLQEAAFFMLVFLYIVINVLRALVRKNQ